MEDKPDFFQAKTMMTSSASSPILPPLSTVSSPEVNKVVAYKQAKAVEKGIENLRLTSQRINHDIRSQIADLGVWEGVTHTSLILRQRL